MKPVLENLCLSAERVCHHTRNFHAAVNCKNQHIYDGGYKFVVSGLHLKYYSYTTQPLSYMYDDDEMMMISLIPKGHSS